MSAAASSVFRTRAALLALAVGAVLALGEAIQSPGLAPYLADSDGYAPDGYGIRLSILSLALQPLFTVLVLAEFGKLLAPDLARRIGDVPARRRAAGVAVATLALLVAFNEAWSIHRDYAALGVVVGDGLLMAGTASLVGGVAVLIWLADRIRLPEFERAGFWLLLSAFTAANLQTEVEAWIELSRFASPTARVGERAIGLTILAVASIVLVAGAMRATIRRAGASPRVWTPLLVWPPFLASILATAVIRGAERAGLGDPRVIADGAIVPETSMLVALAALAVLTPLLVTLHARSVARRHPADARWPGQRPVLLMLAAVQAAVLSGVLLAQPSWPVHQSGASYIALVVMAWALWTTLAPGDRPAS